MCFGQIEPISVQFFRFLGAVMKVHPILYANFENTRSGYIPILHHCSVSWKITPLYFLAQTSYTLDKNSPSKWNFWTFEWFGENSPNSSCYIWNHKLVFPQTLHITLPCHETKLFCTFSYKSLHDLDKRIWSKCKFWDFQLLAWKLTTFVMSFSSHKSVFL